MNTSAATCRRWRFQFSLRTLFLVTLITALVLGQLTRITHKAAVAAIKRLQGVVVESDGPNGTGTTVYLGTWAGRDGDLIYLTALKNLSEVDFSPMWRFAMIGRTAFAEPRPKPSPISDAGLAQLAAIPTIVRLDLEETGISDVGLRHISRMANIRHLYLDSTQITRGGIAFLKSCSRLESLSVAHTNLGDDAVTEISGLHNLEWLELNYTGVSDGAIESLCKLHRLRFLYVFGTAITMRGAERLHRKLPNCEVTGMCDTPPFRDDKMKMIEWKPGW
jgi:hypothetical protein